MAKKSPEEKNKIIELYLESKKTITDFCSSKSEERPGAVTLLGWLEDSGYKITPANSGTSEHVVASFKYEALKKENDKLKDKVFSMNVRYRKEELLEAMELIEASI